MDNRDYKMMNDRGIMKPNSKMKNRYKIKEKFRCVVYDHHKNETYYQKHSNKYYYLQGEMECYMEFRDEMFEKVEEERIYLRLSQDADLIYKTDKELFTENEVILCEKALNGELVEKEKGTMKTIEETVCNGIYNPGNGTTYYTKMQMDQSIPISDCSDETISIKNTDETIQAQMDKRGAY